jgi:hypothetical protein
MAKALPWYREVIPTFIMQFEQDIKAEAETGCTWLPWARYTEKMGSVTGSSLMTVDLCALDPLADILNLHPAYLFASAESWNSSKNRFMDLSGNGRVGTLQAGAVSVGSVTGNGATWPVPYVGGTTGTQISWGAASIPSTFTICSITRYSGNQKNRNRNRILQCSDRNRNWMHGHGHNGHAGVSYYDRWLTGDRDYTISPKSNWVVACGRNIQTPGSAGLIINGVVTSVAGGGLGQCELAIMPGHSDWQLSRVYVWNTHLPDEVFFEVSKKLNNWLAAGSKAQVFTYKHAHTISVHRRMLTYADAERGHTGGRAGRRSRHISLEQC